MMEETGVPRLRRFLDECCVVDRTAPWETARVIAATLTLINIVTNCAALPAALRQCAPDYLRRCAQLLRQAMLEIREHPEYKCRAGSTPARDAAAVALGVQQQLEAIQEQRRSGAVSAVTIAVEPHIKALQQLLADVRANK